MIGQPTILIVDDEPANVEVLAGSLEELYEVQFALSGQEALARARLSPLPDLILLDVLMPEMDGFAICRLLKVDRRTVDIPVIFVTALANPDEEARGFDCGAVDFISKPFNSVVVRARVRNHLEIKRNRELLQRLAITDGLTGLANRRHFEDALSHEVNRQRRRRGDLSLVLIDVDFFKQYNDHYGHPAGDMVLRSLADALVATLQRPADLIARIGGEEFACLLPETEMEGAMAVAERIRSSVEALAMPHACSQASSCVTVSIGVAHVDSGEPDAGHALYKLADAQLYKAKKRGRNQVVGMEPVNSEPTQSG
ncbi:diguanylate cyclase (GGDEF)-like protein [Chitinivorax tropicus]|uniref:diguanylate cyclase n=1 Tax=Chitinivorax tropicus TaxID=714531 RepID=A0A840ML08_9PROT|nr:diguanylate cyclase (GGDEF)-like protein [Chitinivorax tropicus]